MEEDLIVVICKLVDDTRAGHQHHGTLDNHRLADALIQMISQINIDKSLQILHFLNSYSYSE